MKAVVAGASGFIGRTLLERLRSGGYEIVVLTRRAKGETGAALRYVEWDARTPGPWTREIEGAAAVINLAGENIASGRWSAARKKRILESRVFASRALVEAIIGTAQKPPVFVNASAVGYYGNVPEGEVREDAPAGKGFLAETCVRWEEEALRAESAGVRVVLPRFGVVLGQGGALSKMITPFRLFLGGPLGSGRQWFPWIHVEDAALSMLHAIGKDSFRGPYNAAAPEPITMRGFCKTLGRVLSRPSSLPVPAAALKLVLGEMSEMLLEGQKAVPEKLQTSGYSFRFPKLEPALRDALREGI